MFFLLRLDNSSCNIIMLNVFGDVQRRFELKAMCKERLHFANFFLLPRLREREK